MREAAALIVGYLLGAVLPAYLLARARGIDIRHSGSGNAGTRNAYRLLGLPSAVVIAAYDTLKGLAAMAFADRVLDVPEPFIYAAGVAAVVGHVFPFYLRFRGALGAATSSGLLLYCVFLSLGRGWLPWQWAIGVLVLGLGLFAIFRKWAPASAVALPAAAVAIAASSPSVWFSTLAVLAAAHILGTETRDLRSGLPRLKDETKERMSETRVLLRPAAVAFPVIYLFVDKRPLLVLVGSVALFFIAVDAIRLVSKRVNVAVFRRASFFYRPNERASFSSASLFLIGSFLTLFLFPKPVAGAALLFNTFGDMAAKYAGLQHGRTHVYQRTLEGSVAYFLAGGAAAFVWSRFAPMPDAQWLLGALAASLTELLPVDLNDNFTVPLVSGAVMMVPVVFNLPGFR